ncbi:MAG: NlpC/P60 family protein [Alphaproteobacteria bacterium]|nr:NlpC/P60 family protein [Alphaproteobacteria bacterium]
MSAPANQIMRVITGSAAVRRTPADDAPLDTQMLFGEVFSIEEQKDGWAQGSAVLDRYPGYVRLDMLGPLGPLPTHRVRVPRTFVYRDPDLKSSPLLWLSMNAKLALTAHSGGFSLIEDLGWIYSAHAAPIGMFTEDFVSAAEDFLGTPYLWGGRDGLGLDCSGLLQIAMQSAGRECPRDTYQQVDLGAALPVDMWALRRGDLIFWKGHVGIMRNADTLLHANAYHMQVTREPLADAVARIAQSHGQITGIRRLPKPGV